MPKTGKYAKYIEDHFIPGFTSIENCHERLDVLDSAGLLHYPKQGGNLPYLKYYAEAAAGRAPQNLWLSPAGFNFYNSSQNPDYTGYPTQKPLALLERIILASSNEGDLVLDPFCGVPPHTRG